VKANPFFSFSFLGFVDAKAFIQNNPQYRQGTYYDDQVALLMKFLWQSYEREKTWKGAVSDFEGLNSVPIMTIHKSKGLEFHTVVFIGLEDSAFWSFKTHAKEDTCAFFVAFSRAEKKIIFMFSQKRVTNPDWNPQTQNRTAIGALYQLLEQAGIKPEPFAG